MVKKILMCPNCNTKITIEGNPGEKIYITCSNCESKGSYEFSNKKFTSEKKGNSYALEVRNLSKSFNGFKAVDNVSFEVKVGEIFGFLGPNGAGKTTTIKSILDIIHADSGNILFNNLDILKNEKEVKNYIGYLPEKVAFYNNLTALQNLCFYAEMKNTSKDECKLLIEEFGLKESMNKKVGQYSKGMVQKLGMARAVLGSPKILILDEPSGGLDPRGVVLIRNKIREMRDKGSTIFVSSHVLSEIQEVCDQVAIINKGSLVAKDSVSNLSTKLNLKPTIKVEVEKISDVILKAVKKVKGIDKVDRDNNYLNIVCDPKTKAKIIIAIESAGGNIINLQTKEPSLEDVFLRYTEE